MIKVSGIETERMFHITFDEPEETQYGFVSVIKVSLTEYEDGDKSLSIDCKGREKTSKGKPDMRGKRPSRIRTTVLEGRQLVMDAISGCAPIKFLNDFVYIAGILRAEIEEHKQRIAEENDELTKRILEN